MSRVQLQIVTNFRLMAMAVTTDLVATLSSPDVCFLQDKCEQMETVERMYTYRLRTTRNKEHDIIYV